MRPILFPSWKQRMWHELHMRAADPRTPLASEAAWLQRFTRRIPCRRCRGHWQRLLRAHPPELRSRYEYFRWTVRMHNAVADRLGRPRLSWADACAEWHFCP